MKFLDYGGFSNVFEFDENCISKIYKKKDWISRRLFWNEITIMKKLQHRQIPRLIHFNDKDMSIIMEKKAGTSLDKIIEQYDLSYDEKKNIAIQLIKILMYIHSKNILYLDLKPDNILLDQETMKISLIDFNLSMIHGEKNTSRRGSIGYMSPEMLYKDSYSFPTDVYSLGIFLFVLFTSLPPTTFYNYDYYMPIKIKKIVKLCTREEPRDRPCLKKILQIMNQNIFWIYWYYWWV